MDSINYSKDVDYGDKNPKKFQITRGMLIIAGIIIIIVIIIVIVINIVLKNKNANNITKNDCIMLEKRMESESPVYVIQKQILLTDKEIKIDLNELYTENGGGILKEKNKASKICKGYVLASKNENENYDAFIKCGNIYTTPGYIDEKEKTTTKKKKPKDNTKPVISLIGSKTISLKLKEKYNEPGFTAIDNIDGDLTSMVKVENNINNEVPGEYNVTYSVKDKAGNKSKENRKVIVLNIPLETTTTTTTTTTKRTTTKRPKPVTTTRKVTTRPSYKPTTKRCTSKPSIYLNGSTVVNLNVGSKYNEPGFSARDCFNNDLTSKVKISSNINIYSAGNYYVNYTVTDRYGNRSSKTRTVIVKSKGKPLNGISISPNNVVLKVKETKKVTVYYSPSDATNKSLRWSTSNAAVATINNGIIYGNSRGTATITARSSNGLTASIKVTVN